MTQRRTAVRWELIRRFQEVFHLLALEYIGLWAQNSVTDGNVLIPLTAHDPVTILTKYMMGG